MTDYEITDRSGLRGWGWAELVTPTGAVVASARFENLVTQYGDQFYAERAAGLGTNPVITGMQLGTSATAAAKTGAGAAIISYVTGSSVAITNGYPQSSLVSGSRQITYKCGWAPGVAQVNNLRAVALVNQAIGTDAGAPVGATIARAVFGVTLDKSASTLSLFVTWNHLLLGA